MKITKIALLLIIVVLIVSFFSLNLQQYFELEYLKSQKETVAYYRETHPVLSLWLYFLLYIVITGLSLPGAWVLTLIGGAVFGLLWGTLISSFASVIGATLAFMLARFLFRDAIYSRFESQLKSINNSFERDGAFYLFTLRLLPIFPFFMINLAMGLTTIRLWTFFWVSQISMLAGTVIYVNAGTQLAKITVLADILSPVLLGSLALLGLLPWLAKKIITTLKKISLYKPWSKPKQFDNNIIVIGGGSGGLVAAYIAATLKAKVSLIEKHKLGGDCLNTGCVPSKTLISSAKYLSQIKRFAEFGIGQVNVNFDFATVMQRVQKVIKTIEPHDSSERYTKLGVEVITGEAKIISPWEVRVKTAKDVKVLTTRSIVIATGARPILPDIPGLEQVSPHTSETIWNLKVLPKHLLVLGGGPVGSELAQSFSRFGSHVTIVQKSTRLLTREDPEVSSAIMSSFKQEGIDLKLGCIAKKFMIEDGTKIMLADYRGQSIKIAFDQVLIAIGRAATISGYGVENLNISLSTSNTIATNAFQETNYPNIYACGDVAGPYQFTHIAAHQAWYAAVNALFGKFKKFRTDYSIIPYATFTDPEVARVGLNEQEAKAQDIVYEVSTYGIDALDRAITDSKAYGFVKVLTPPRKDKILGVTIVGNHAGDLIAEFVLAMKHGIGLNKILKTIHIYPTLAESNKYVAGVWKKAHISKSVLNLMERYAAWCRK